MVVVFWMPAASAALLHADQASETARPKRILPIRFGDAVSDALDESSVAVVRPLVAHQPPLLGIAVVLPADAEQASKAALLQRTLMFRFQKCRCRCSAPTSCSSCGSGMTTGGSLASDCQTTTTQPNERLHGASDCLAR